MCTQASDYRNKKKKKAFCTIQGLHQKNEIKINKKMRWKEMREWGEKERTKPRYLCPKNLLLTLLIYLETGEIISVNQLRSLQSLFNIYSSCHLLYVHWSFKLRHKSSMWSIRCGKQSNLQQNAGSNYQINANYLVTIHRGLFMVSLLDHKSSLAVDRICLCQQIFLVKCKDVVV